MGGYGRVCKDLAGYGKVWKCFERLLRDLRRVIVPGFLCHSHSALCKFCPVALERTKR